LTQIRKVDPKVLADRKKQAEQLARAMNEYLEFVEDPTHEDPHNLSM
jgi:hypothetical protein